MDNFNFYSPTEFVFGIGDGRTGGFVSLSADDIAAIYRIAVKASV